MATTKLNISPSEHDIQRACVAWFRIQHSQLTPNLIAIPNGGRRDAVTGARLKAEGVIAGAPDLVLFVPSHPYGALFVEMKTRGGRQSPSQRTWQAHVCGSGDYKYVICRSLSEFQYEVNAYLNNE